MKLHRANNNNSLSMIIPKEISKKLNWEIGDNILCYISNNSVIVRNIDKQPFENTRGEINEAQ